MTQPGDGCVSGRPPNYFMNQDEINQQEWSNPNNWSLLTYKSKRDSRVLVPKSFGFGWTINFGNRKGVWLFAALMAIPVGGMIISIITAVVFGGK